MKLPPDPGRWRGVLLSCSLVFVSVCAAVAAPLPKECKPPAVLATTIRTTPSAKSLDTAGTWFTDHGELQCAAAAFSEAIQLTPDSPESHYGLGLARVELKQTSAAIDEFRLALKYQPDMSLTRNHLGSLLADLGRTDEAEVEFREVLSADPNSVYALDHLAKLLAANRRYNAAISYWKRALTLQHDSPDMVLSMGIAIYQDGKPQESINILTALIQTHPDMKSAHFGLAGVYAHEKRFREASAEYTQVMQLDPKDNEALLAQVTGLISAAAYQDALDPAQEYARRKPDDLQGHLLLGSVYSALGEYGIAEGELARAVSRMPENTSAQYEIGLTLALDQKPKQALPHLEKALALDPSNTAARYHLARVLRTLGDNERSQQIFEELKKGDHEQSRGNQIGVLTSQANEFLEAGQAAKAAEVYRQILAIDPQDARTEYNLALALSAGPDEEEERKALEKAIGLDLNLAVAKLELGRLDLSQGNIESAQKWLRAALEIDPQLAPAKETLGVMFAKQGNGVGAEKLFREAIEDDPNYIQAYVDLGLVLAQQRKLKAAETELDKAVQLAPSNLQALSADAKVKERLGKNGAAVVLLRSAVSQAPQSVDAHLALAIALAQGYDLPGALAETSEAVRIAPNSSVAHFNRGRVLFYLSRNQEAQVDFKIASWLAPQMPEPYYFLALIEKQAQNYEEASSLFESVAKLQPQNAMAWYQWGEALEHASRQKEAIASWRQAISLDPEHIQSLRSLARVLLPTEPAEAARLDAQIVAVQKKNMLLTRPRLWQMTPSLPCKPMIGQKRLRSRRKPFKVAVTALCRQTSTRTWA